MIAASKIDFATLLYILVPVGVIVLLCSIMFLHHRRPRTIEADMESFSRGLRALAPERVPVEEARRPSAEGEPVIDLRPIRPPGYRGTVRPGTPPMSSGGAGADGKEARSG